MKRWTWVALGVAALVYFGYVRETEARLFRRCRTAYCAPCPPPPARLDPCDPHVICQPYTTVVVGPTPTPSGPTITTPPTPPVTPDKPPTPPVTPDKPPTPPPVVPIPDIKPPVVPPAVDPPPVPAKPDTLTALLIADDSKADAGSSARAGAALVDALLKAGLKPERLAAIKPLSGRDLSADAVLAEVDQLKVKPGDTLLVYYAGAGLYDEAAQDFVLTPGAGNSKLPRSRLRTALLAKRARLTLLLTDTLSNAAKPEDAPKPLPAPKGAQLDKLFFGYKGVVDLQGCSENEYAFPRGDTGGLFTTAFVQELAARTDPASVVGWAELLENVITRTDSLYKDFQTDVLRAGPAVPAQVKTLYRAQKTQTPKIVTPIEQVVPAEALPAAPAAPGRNALDDTLRDLPLPAMTDAGLPRSAEMVVTVPADAEVYVDGFKTEPREGDRVFTTPPLVPGKKYAYTIRAEVVRNGVRLVEAKRVPVAAGEPTKVLFTEESLAQTQAVAK